MQRISGMRLVVAAAFFLCSFFAVSGTASATVKVAIIPYINSSAEEREVVDETIHKKLEEYFQNAHYSIIPTEIVTSFLARNGYDLTPMILPEKEVLVALANATGADAVLAMDFARIQVYRRYTLLTATTVGSVSIYAKALSAQDSNFVSLRIEKKARLTSYRFGPGYREKTAIAAGIEEAMDELFSRLPF